VSTHAGAQEPAGSSAFPQAEDHDAVLLTPDLLRKLERLSLRSSRIFAGRMQGERRSPRRGSSVEFADFREYSHGDDLRYVDWNAYARLERLFLKLYVDEQELHVRFLLDTSRSMGFGAPSKLLTARRLCAALGYIALSGQERISTNALTDVIGTPLRDVRGKAGSRVLFDWLRAQRPAGATDFARALGDFSRRTRIPSLVFLVSDFLGPGLEDGLRTLVGRGFAPVLLQIIAPEELNPPMSGDLRLVDAETGATREITITAGVLRHYRQRVAAHQQQIIDLGKRFGTPVLRLSTSDTLESFILHYLKARQVVQ